MNAKETHKEVKNMPGGFKIVKVFIVGENGVEEEKGFAVLAPNGSIYLCNNDSFYCSEIEAKKLAESLHDKQLGIEKNTRER